MPPHNQNSHEADPFAAQPSAYMAELQQMQVNGELMGAPEHIQTVYTEALGNAVDNAHHAENNDAKIVERATHDREVETARHKLEEVFGDAAHQVEKTTMEQTLATHYIGQHKREEIAEAAASGSSPAEEVNEPILRGKNQVLENQTDDKEARTQMLGIHDRNNGATPTFMRKLTNKLEGRLNNLGVLSRRTQKARKAELTAELAATTDEVERGGNAAELDISQASVAERATDEVVGHELLEAMGSPRRMSGETRQQLYKLWQENPKAAKALFEAAAHQRTDGNVSDLTARRVGHEMQQINKTAA